MNAMPLVELVRCLDGSYTVNKSPLWICMSRSSGLRAIFDPYCAEWVWLPIDEKISILRQFMSRVSFEVIVESYCLSWEKSVKKEYVLQEVPEAIYRLTEYLPEAAEYYVASPRCQTHWRRRGGIWNAEPTLNDFLNKANDIVDRNLNHDANKRELCS